MIWRDITGLITPRMVASKLLLIPFSHLLRAGLGRCQLAAGRSADDPNSDLILHTPLLMQLASHSITDLMVILLLSFNLLIIIVIHASRMSTAPQVLNGTVELLGQIVERAVAGQSVLDAATLQ